MSVTYRHIPEQPVAGKPLGRHVEHDERSRAFAATFATVTLQKTLWSRVGGVLDQGNLGSCTGNAIAGAINTKPLHHTGATVMKEKDAVVFYTAATHLDNVPGSYPPDDTGSSGLAVCKAAKAAGKIGSYKHAFTVTQALAALMSGPVIIGVDWYEGFDHPDPNGVVTIAGQVRGGHEFEVVGYDPATDLVTCWNSWGSGWGKSGKFLFTSKTWAKLLAAQGDVTVPLPVTV